MTLFAHLPVVESDDDESCESDGEVGEESDGGAEGRKVTVVPPRQVVPISRAKSPGAGLKSLEGRMSLCSIGNRA